MLQPHVKVKGIVDPSAPAQTAFFRCVGGTGNISGLRDTLMQDRCAAFIGKTGNPYTS